MWVPITFGAQRNAWAAGWGRDQFLGPVILMPSYRGYLQHTATDNFWLSKIIPDDFSREISTFPRERESSSSRFFQDLDRVQGRRNEVSVEWGSAGTDFAFAANGCTPISKPLRKTLRETSLFYCTCGQTKLSRRFSHGCPHAARGEGANWCGLAASVLSKPPPSPCSSMMPYIYT